VQLTLVELGCLQVDIGVPLQDVDEDADKLIFWTDLGRLAKANKHFCGLIYVSEIWLRSLDGFPEKRMSELPISGEALQIVVANRDICLSRRIPIVRKGEETRLDRAAMVDTKVQPNFLAPLRRAWNERAAM
jgi:hypothetical protein